MRFARASSRKERGTGLGVLAVLTAAAAGTIGAQRPGPDATGFRWRNAFLSVSWAPGEATVRVRNLRTNHSIRIPATIGALAFDTGRVSGFQVEPRRAAVETRRQTTVWRFALREVRVPGREASLRSLVTFTFDKAAPWVRKKARIELIGEGEPLLLKEVVLGDVPLANQHPRQRFDGWQSYPVLADAFFCGVEFPVAGTRVQEGAARLSYRPGTRLAPGRPYTTWSAILGVTPAGKSRESFESYIDSLRKTAAPMHIQYNSWWSAPAPFTEQHMLDLIQTFHDAFYKPYGTRLDTFCLDMGWSKRKSIWRIDEGRFPQGFGNLVRKLQAMETRLGLWVSPSSCYPGGLDNEWAGDNGYETFRRKGRTHPYACLAGVNYRSAFKASLLDLIRRYGITHFKFDGYIPECPAKGHGHEPGALSSEKIALGIIDLFKALRAANPAVWIEATCFGFKPSPWWLAHVDTVIGTYGDDAPHGRVPCPVYRESYTTGRDFFNLQGAKDGVVPIRGQEVLGIIHQSPAPLQNDAVTTILRGHGFVPLYVNPKYMNARRWRFLARLCSWARDNATLLAHTTPLDLGRWANAPPQPAERTAPREPYGYAHCDGEKGLLLLRNPWVKPTEVELRLEESTGFGVCFKPGSAVSLYPDFRKLARPVAYGDRLTVELGPYETRLLAFGGYPAAPAPAEDKYTLAAARISSDVSDLESKLQLQFSASGNMPSKQVWVLAEADGACSPPDCRMAAGGARIDPEIIESAMGWRASGRKISEHWAWAVGDLPSGDSRVKLDVAVLDDVRLSVWLVGKEPVPDDHGPTRPIPPPEQRFLNAVEVLSPIQLRYAGAAKLTNVALASQGAMATASSTWSAEHDPRFLIDGSNSTRWNSAAGDKDGAWVRVDFGATRRIHEIRFLEAARGRITEYKLQYWKQGGWQDLLTAAKPRRRTQVRHRFAPVETSQIRLVVLDAIDVPSIYEIEVRADVAPATQPK